MIALRSLLRPSCIEGKASTLASTAGGNAGQWVLNTISFFRCCPPDTRRARLICMRESRERTTFFPRNRGRLRYLVPPVRFPTGHSKIISYRAHLTPRHPILVLSSLSRRGTFWIAPSLPTVPSNTQNVLIAIAQPADGILVYSRLFGVQVHKEVPVYSTEMAPDSATLSVCHSNRPFETAA